MSSVSRRDPDVKAANLFIDVASRAKTELIDELRQSGLWLNRGRVNTIHGDQYARGETFLNTVLGDYLGAEDFALFGSERIFGYARYGLRSRLPVMAGFGFEIGNAFHKWLGGSIETRSQASELCAVFFAGTALFDLVCDESSAGASGLFEIFDQSTLQDMLTDSAAAVRRLDSSPLRDSTELRLLFRTMALFYARLNSLLATRSNSMIPGLIERCYAAQMTTALPVAAFGSLCVPAFAEQKSVLPFEIMYRLAQLFARDGPINEEDGDGCDGIAGELGRVLWRIDDIADLRLDLESGAANDIVRRVNIGVNDKDSESAAARLLCSSALPEIAREIGSDLQLVVSRIECRNIRMDGSWKFEHWLLAAVRGWLEPRNSAP